MLQIHNYLFLVFFSFCSITLNGQNNKFRNSQISLGVNYVAQRTQTLTVNELSTPYFNTWGNNQGLGGSIHYLHGKKNDFFLNYNRIDLINTIDITRNNWYFGKNDQKSNKPFSIHWKSHEIGVGLNHLLSSQKRFSINYQFEICSNFGQLTIDNFPKQLSLDTMVKDVEFQNGQPAYLVYSFSLKSVKDIGLNVLNGLALKFKLSNKVNLNVSVLSNFGLRPLVSSKIYYSVKSKSNNLQVDDHNYMISNNSGFRTCFELTYRFL